MMAFFWMIVLGGTVGGVASVILTFTKYRHSEIVVISALPAFVVGLLYTGAFLKSLGSPPNADSPTVGFAAFCGMLLVFGAFSIFRCYYKRP